jgi:hypothetical protein
MPLPPGFLVIRGGIVTDRRLYEGFLDGFQKLDHYCTSVWCAALPLEALVSAVQREKPKALPNLQLSLSDSARINQFEIEKTDGPYHYSIKVDDPSPDVLARLVAAFDFPPVGNPSPARKQ